MNHHRRGHSVRGREDGLSTLTVESMDAQVHIKKLLSHASCSLGCSGEYSSVCYLSAMQLHALVDAYLDHLVRRGSVERVTRV